MSSQDPIETRANPHPFAMVSYALAEAVSATAVLLYIKLSRYADNQTGAAWPSRGTLAAELGFKQARGVDQYLAELEQAGAITVEARYRPGTRERLPNVYMVKRAHEMTVVRVPEKPAKGSAPKRTTPPAEVVHENALGGAPERTGVVRENAQELRTNELRTNELRFPEADAPGQGSLVEIAPAVKSPEEILTEQAQYVARTLVERHPALKFPAMMTMAKRMMKAYHVDAPTVGRTMEGIYTGGGALTDQKVGQVLEGLVAPTGRAKKPTKDDKIRETLSMSLSTTPALTGTPFEPQLRITS